MIWNMLKINRTDEWSAAVPQGTLFILHCPALEIGELVRLNLSAQDILTPCSW